MSEKRRDLEPLLKDLSEKTRSFKRNVVSLAVEFKDARSRLASLEESSPHKSLTQQACIANLPFSCSLYSFETYFKTSF